MLLFFLLLVPVRTAGSTDVLVTACVFGGSRSHIGAQARAKAEAECTSLRAAVDRAKDQARELRDEVQVSTLVQFGGADRCALHVCVPVPRP